MTDSLHRQAQSPGVLSRGFGDVPGDSPGSSRQHPAPGRHPDRETTNSTRNTKNRIFAATIEVPATLVNPNRAAIKATTRNKTAQRSMVSPPVKYSGPNPAYRNCRGSDPRQATTKSAISAAGATRQAYRIWSLEVFEGTGHVMSTRRANRELVSGLAGGDVRSFEPPLANHEGCSRANTTPGMECVYRSSDEIDCGQDPDHRRLNQGSRRLHPCILRKQGTAKTSEKTRRMQGCKDATGYV